MRDELLFKEECYAIQGAIFEVNRQLGAGFLESVYQECLERELAARDIPFQSQPELSLSYKGQVLQQTFKADLVCHGRAYCVLQRVTTLPTLASPAYWCGGEEN